MGDITQVKRLLVDRVHDVVQHLLPNGRKEGNEWRVGSVHGEAGKSLGVHLTGEKAGVWKDFGSGAVDDGGDLLDLWCATRRISLSEALIEARSWLGIELPKPVREPKKSYKKPPKPDCGNPQGRVMDYLREDRNIPAEIIKKYMIGEKGSVMFFPFVLPDQSLAMVKRREAQDGAKTVPTSSDCEPVLFGWQSIPDDAREIIITEGEIDALSWATYGYLAMSVPFGGGAKNKQQWIENDFDRLERFEKIFIGTDMDDEGNAAAEEIAGRLGRHRCLRVEIPHKDANECLVRGLSQEIMDRCISDARHLDPEGLRRATDFLDEVVHLFWPGDETHLGYRVPYSKVGNRLLFRPAELTIWCGATGNGKSQILSDCIVDWIAQNSRVCLSSLEMKPGQTLKRMCKQVVGIDRPSEMAIGQSLTWLDRGLLLYERVGKAGVTGLLDVFNYARAKYGCDQFVIDSLMRLGVASDDYVGQEKAVFELIDWTIANNVHVHLVAHSRKGGDKRTGPETTEDIKGAMEIGANAFNVIVVWRNRKLEEQIEESQDKEELEELKKVPGVVMNVAKQRNGDFEGKIGLWFNTDNYRYRSAHDRSGIWDRDYLTGGKNEADAT